MAPNPEKLEVCSHRRERKKRADGQDEHLGDDFGIIPYEHGDGDPQEGDRDEPWERFPASRNRDGPVVVPWNEWGPQHTRMLKLSGNPHHPLRHVHGERVVHPSPQNGSAIRVLDFGMSTLRRRFPGEAQPDAQCVTVLHTEPSTISDERFVARSVTTSLPYREVVRPVDDSEIQCDLFLIDNDHIIRVDKTCQIQPVVYTFY
ncbi:hypothetical protein GGX14DRAFT_647881 [Mycena pura]|uniref:Uncharacterized protein n=1 Tax=Mycena pura TaxID=153505 RepID=A0AAD6Y7L0_9AGAR|nr:hypothetical protein GGX14DRAFT_647881 [Mycena pura]